MNGLAASIAFLCASLAVAPAAAEDAQDGWQIGVEKPHQAETPPESSAPRTPETSPDQTTVVPRSPPNANADQGGEITQVRLVAQLTADGQHIDQGLVWRVFQESEQANGKSKLLSTHRDASPVLKLKPGEYVINAAFGRAYLTRKITVKPGAAAPTVEPFVLNAGGLRVAALVGGKQAPQNSVSCAIYSDRDQSDSRKLIMSAVKPGLIIRLNAGIYHVISTYGDANATVASDVTVEAGKLTETTIAHAAATATFRLVNRPGGEAVPDTQWSIQSADGDVIKESVGALPTHILAPGTYTVIAKSQGKAFQREFSLSDGEITQVEVIIK